jgi:hypothetical protein
MKNTIRRAQYRHGGTPEPGHRRNVLPCFKSKHVDSTACKLAGKAEVAARIKELSRRISNAVTPSAGDSS